MVSECGRKGRVFGGTKEVVHCGKKFFRRSGIENTIARVFSFSRRDHVGNFSSVCLKDLFMNSEAGRAPTTFSTTSLAFSVGDFRMEPRGRRAVGKSASSGWSVFIE